MNTTEMTEIGIPQVKKVLYTASVHTTGGRDSGLSKSSDGKLEVKTSLPGGPGNGTNPEQLFAAGWSTCFTSAMKAAAGKMKLKFPPDHAMEAEVDLCLDEKDTYFIRARINVSLPGLDHETARSIVDAAHHMCPYSRVTRGNIDVQINLL